MWDYMLPKTCVLSRNLTHNLERTHLDKIRSEMRNRPRRCSNLRGFDERYANYVDNIDVSKDHLGSDGGVSGGCLGEFVVGVRAGEGRLLLWSCRRVCLHNYHAQRIAS
jgi:hypothetical protein